MHQPADDRFEYLVITSFPGEPKQLARAGPEGARRERQVGAGAHLPLRGRGLQILLRRRVMRVTGTLEAQSSSGPTSQLATVFAAEAALDGWYQLACTSR
ncbi:hypothetical protein [Arthrobacter sp. JCM 19049]|uniref:hypothetical protein n=1 Tax=Arthrobacter sp. JCM 19049 TaxID=1460643 RepID=UPI0024367B21|nr:hypothetical protein [Arthrobacter sp. JCM 19049]